MKCPKCGQEMIHINNQYICTACGIVANEFSPKQQVLGAIKKKMVAQTTPKQEEYVSPVAIATKKDPKTRENLVDSRQNIDSRVIPVGTTLDQIIKEMAMHEKNPVENTASTGSKEDYITQDEGEKVIPRLETTGTNMADAQVQENVSPIPQAQNQFSVEQTQAVQTGEMSRQDTSTVNIGFSALSPQNVILDSQADPMLDNNSKVIYPSHQVNPILIKTFITVFSLLVLFVIIYFAYANFHGFKGLFDSIIKFLGENIFK